VKEWETLRYLLNAVFDTSLDFTGFDISIDMNFLCPESNDKYGDIGWRKESRRYNIHSSNIKNLSIWT
jgi:hypothetical protein